MQLALFYVVIVWSAHVHALCAVCMWWYLCPLHMPVSMHDVRSMMHDDSNSIPDDHGNMCNSKTYTCAWSVMSISSVV